MRRIIAYTKKKSVYSGLIRYTELDDAFVSIRSYKPDTKLYEIIWSPLFQFTT